MSITVRHATLDDGENLLELWHGFTANRAKFDERYEHKESADERWLNYFENQLVDSKYGTVIVAENGDDELVGVLEARVVGNHPIFRLENHGYINGHYVLEEHRNSGIGKTLLDKAYEWFASEPRDVNFYRVNVLEGNNDAEERYKKYGLEPVEHTYEGQIE